MRWFGEFARRVAMLARRRRFDREMDEEIRVHVELREKEHAESGISDEDAHRIARIQFGNALALREASRGAWGWSWLEHLHQDLRYAVRMLRKSPGFTAVAILTLALGIGANTAIFSVVYGVLLERLPYRNASRLIVLNETTPKVGAVSVSYPDFLDWRAENHSFSQMAAVYGANFNLSGATQPENINGDAVSSNFLSMLGVRPYRGRDFQSGEGKPGTAPVAMLSYALWKSHFGGEQNAIGRSIELDGRSFTIIGVLPPNYRAPDKTDVLVPVGVLSTEDYGMTDRGARGNMAVIGRLAPGVSFVEARAEMQGIAARLAKEYPLSNDEFGVKLQPIRTVFAGEIRPALLVLFAAVLFVLLIACANVANLFLVRGAARTKEIALRIAFGASRGRIIRQMLTESFVLAFLGGAIGVALAFAASQGISALILPDMLAGATVTLNGSVLLFAGGIIVLCAFIFGLAPALHATKPDVQTELKEGSRTSSAGAAQNRLRGILAIIEISLALVLLAGAGLMMKTLYSLLSVNPGFHTNHVLTMEMDLRTQQYSKDPAILNFWQQLLMHARALPGVESAALGSGVPLTDDHSRTDITIEGMPLPRPGSWPHPDVHIVSPSYARTLAIPLLRGRAFTDADNATAPQVALVNEKLARQFFPHANPVGKRFIFGHPTAKNPPKWVTIVGVLGNTKLYGLVNPARLEVYLPLQQAADPDMHLLVKSALPPSALMPAIRNVVSSIDKNQPIFSVATMKELVKQDVATQRMTLLLLGAFSGLALVLAAIGVYGVISYSVTQRTHEIGIRMALGAQHRDVLRMVFLEGGRMALAGIAIGIVCAFALTHLMASLLFSVSATDPLIFAAVAIVLFLVTMLACYVPARRAIHVDPMIALRYE